MRKSLLRFVMGGVCILASTAQVSAQAISLVGPRVLISTQTPSAIEGMKNFSYSSDPALAPGTWGGAIGQIWNAIPLVLADATDSLICTATPGSLTGKWAMVFRGDCEFGYKAKKAQDAGATGVMIVNNIPGAGPVNMGAGAQGSLVTIPTIMISNTDGLAIDAVMHTGNNVFISVTPYGFGNSHDLCIPNQLYSLSPGFAIPANQLDAGNGNPKAYKSFMSALVANTGTSDETNVQLKLNVDWIPTAGSPSNFFKDSIAIPGTFAVLDSLDNVNSTSTAFDMHASGTGRFDFTYTATCANTDALPIDNIQKFSMYATNAAFCNSQYNIISGKPLVTGGLRMNPQSVTALSMTWGPLFYVAHAADAYNLQMALYAVDTTQHDLNFVQNTPGLFFTVLFKWTDANTNDVIEPTELTLMGTGNHTFSTADSNGAIFVAPFDSVIHLEANTYYWAASVTSNNDLFVGSDGNSNYFNRSFASDHLTSGGFKSFWAPLYEGGITVDHLDNLTDTVSMVPFAPNKIIAYQPTDSLPITFGENVPAVAMNTQFIPENVKSTIVRENNFTVFPNPARENINVKVDFPVSVNNVTFTLMNAVGQVVYTVNKGTIKDATISLPVGSVAPGNYYVIMHAGGRTTFRSITIAK